MRDYRGFRAYGLGFRLFEEVQYAIVLRGQDFIQRASS